MTQIQILKTGIDTLNELRKEFNGFVDSINLIYTKRNGTPKAPESKP